MKLSHKRFASLILALSLALPLAACDTGKANETDPGSEDIKISDTVQETIESENNEASKESETDGEGSAPSADSESLTDDTCESESYGATESSPEPEESESEEAGLKVRTEEDIAPALDACVILKTSYTAVSLYGERKVVFEEGVTPGMAEGMLCVPLSFVDEVLGQEYSWSDVYLEGGEDYYDVNAFKGVFADVRIFGELGIILLCTEKLIISDALEELFMIKASNAVTVGKSYSARMKGDRPVIFESDEMIAFSLSKAKAHVEHWASGWANVQKNAALVLTSGASPYTGESATEFRLAACQDFIGARYLALTYLGTGDKSYLNAAVDILNLYAKSSPKLGSDETLDYSAATINGQSDIGLNIALPLTTFCEVYALLYNHISEEDRAIMADWIRVEAELVKKGHEYWISNNYYDKQYGNNHLTCHLMGLIAAAYALEDDALLNYALDSTLNEACFGEMIERAILMKGDETWYKDIDSDFAEGEIYDRYRVVQNAGFGYAIYHLKFLTNCAAILKNNGIDYFSYYGDNGENLSIPYHAYAEYLLKDNVNLGTGHYTGSPMSRQDALFSYIMANYYYEDEVIANVVEKLMSEGVYPFDKETFGRSPAYIYSK